MHDDHRVGNRYADGEHPGGRALRPARSWTDAPVARPGGAQWSTGLRLSLPSAGTHAERGGLRAAPNDRRVHRSRIRLPDRHARSGDPRRREPPRRVTVRAHRRGRLRPLLPDGHRSGGRDEGGTAADPTVGVARHPDRCVPAGRLCRQGGVEARGLSTARPGHHRRGGGQHPRRVGGPLRPRSGRGGDVVDDR